MPFAVEPQPRRSTRLTSIPIPNAAKRPLESDPEIEVGKKPRVAEKPPAKPSASKSKSVLKTSKYIPKPDFKKFPNELDKAVEPDIYSDADTQPTRTSKPSAARKKTTKANKAPKRTLASHAQTPAQDKNAKRNAPQLPPSKVKTSAHRFKEAYLKKHAGKDGYSDKGHQIKFYMRKGAGYQVSLATNPQYPNIYNLARASAVGQNVMQRILDNRDLFPRVVNLDDLKSATMTLYFEGRLKPNDIVIKHIGTFKQDNIGKPMLHWDGYHRDLGDHIGGDREVMQKVLEGNPLPTVKAFCRKQGIEGNWPWSNDGEARYECVQPKKAQIYTVLRMYKTLTPSEQSEVNKIFQRLKKDSEEEENHEKGDEEEEEEEEEDSEEDTEEDEEEDTEEDEEE